MKNKSHNERGVLSTMPGNVYGHSHTKAAGCSLYVENTNSLSKDNEILSDYLLPYK